MFDPSEPTPTPATRFEETQRLRDGKWFPLLLAVLIIGTLAPLGLPLLQALPPDARAALPPVPEELASVPAIVFSVALGLGLVALLLAIRMTVRVTEQGVEIRFVPMPLIALPFGRIASAEVRPIHPMREFGGYGARPLLGSRFPGGGWFYGLRGAEAVDLVLTDGKRVVIGSQRAPELLAAVEDGRRA